VREVTLILAAYLLGAVPCGLLVARLTGAGDLRRVGSGNIGATNVLRVAGKGAAALTLVGDLGKGAAAVLLARWWNAPGGLIALVGVAAVIGHVFPVFLGFRGGKGVATTLGVALAALPSLGLALLGIWLVVAGVWRYSSLAALSAAAAMPLLAWILDGRPALVGMAGALVLLIFWRHRDNISRLLRGSESKIGQKVSGVRPTPPDTRGA
jgi:acyl phosphate:glycerol-3-phosphate acyltransferase